MRTLLIDADITAYQYAAKAQKVWDFGDGEPTVVVEPIEKIIPLVADKLREFKAQLDADEFVICLSCATADGWRKQILPTYKDGRGEKPQLLAPIKQWLRETYRTFERPTLEADDVMGILSTSDKIIQGEKIIVSIDKDMKTIPGWLFNPDKDNKPWRVSEAEADYWHLYQTLVGDATDNYKGCPKVGPVKAAALLEHMDKHHDFSNTWGVVCGAFEKAGLTEADALLQARVARICRATDYNYSTKEVKLWTPR